MPFVCTQSKHKYPDRLLPAFYKAKETIMSRPYLVKASSPTATYRAGTFEANSPEDACELARDRYARSGLGRAMGDADAFRYFVAGEGQHREPWQPVEYPRADPSQQLARAATARPHRSPTQTAGGACAGVRCQGAASSC